MNKWIGLLIGSILLPGMVSAQDRSTRDALRFNLNGSGSHYFQVTFLNQAWLRYVQLNPGSTIQGRPYDNTFDIGLRRTRIGMFGQLSDRVFLYFQFGMNNFNAQTNLDSNRKYSAFFHDALCEYRLGEGERLKLGTGLTIANGLSRFSQPSVGTIMTMDVPVFAQATVDQTDEFSRKLSVFARGQIGRFDYRAILSQPFPIASNGSTPPVLSDLSTFSQLGRQFQVQGYLVHQFFEHEPNTTPYMTGTYLGDKKVFNIAAGAIYQEDAMWRSTSNGDTLYAPMAHVALESFLDMPLNKERGSAISAYAGYFNTNYGSDYLRYNGIMNVASGTTLDATNSITGQGPTYGNAFPMFGTGSVVYAQVGYLLPSRTDGSPRLMPYAAGTFSRYERLNGNACDTYSVGINYFINGQRAKFTLDIQNRPVFKVIEGDVRASERLNCFTLQYQILI
ncbi:MAG: hypothetical protein KDC00_10880 [Flavobacteriales bacterium]|nr:hypothetical protein [Flavobacteriales bacterium]